MRTEVRKSNASKAGGEMYPIAPGTPLQQGAHLASDGVNFALFSRHATRVWLLLFANVDADLPFQTIELDRVHHKTGVEMEALTAVAVAALTIYDMVKAVDPAAEINDIHVDEKTGGKTGLWQREH